MKARNPLLIALGAVAILALAMFSLNAIRANRGRAELAEQLRLARQEGIPTTWPEFEATLPVVPPDENAAPFYTRIREFYKSHSRARTKAADLANAITFRNSLADRADAASLLLTYDPVVRCGDEATRRPSYRPERDWKRTPLLADFGPLDMKDVGRLYALRGSVYAQKGDSAQAIADARRIFRLADHSSQIPDSLAHLLGQTTYRQGVMALAEWAFAFPDRPEYAAELQRAVADFPDLDLREEFSPELLQCLDLFETSLTSPGRASMGLRNTAVSPLEILLRSRTTEATAKANIVKAEREFWAALRPGTTQQTARIDLAREHLSQGLAAYPTADQMIRMLLPNPNDRIATWPQNKIELTALARAFAGGKINRTIRTDDLISPFDGKPLRYRYDGKQLRISIGAVQDLTIPPAAFTKP